MGQRFGISTKKEEEILALMQELQIYENDLDESFTKGSGKGGQKKNKTSNAVILRHIPTNLIVRFEQYRERAVNRILARRALCELFSEKILGVPMIDSHIEKKRKQKARNRRKRRMKDEE